MRRYLLYGFSLLALVGCNDANIEEDRYQYTLRNTSPVAVQVSSFDSRSQALFNEISLPVNASLVVDTLIHPWEDVFDAQAFLGGGDSVVLTFSDGKALRYRCKRFSSDTLCEVPRNILSNFSVESTGDQQGLLIVGEYTITQADYERAE